MKWGNIMKHVRLLVCLGIISLLCVVIPGCHENTEFLDMFGDNEEYKNLEAVTLTLCVPGWYEGEVREYTREVLDEIERRTRDSIKVKLNLVTLDYISYESELKRVMTEGEPCDMYFSFFDQSFNILKTMSDAGLALDLTTLFPRYAPHYARLLSPEDQTALVVDGKLLGVRNNYPEVDRASIVVRDELLQKYNQGPFQGLGDLEAFVDTLRKHENGIVALTTTRPLLSIVAPGSGYAVLDYDLALVYKWNDPEMKVMAWEQTPEYARILQRASRLIREASGDAMPFPIVTADPILIRNKRWGAWIMNEGDSAYFNEVLYTAQDDGKFIEFPLFPDVPVQRIAHPPSSWMINPQSKHPERALMFLEWVHANQKNYDLIRYGIEGKTYVLKGDQFDFPENVTRQDSYLERSGFWDLFMDINFERTHVSCSPDFREKRRDMLLHRSAYPPHGVFQLDFSGMDTAIRKMMMGEVEWKLLSGGFTADTLKEYIREEKERGIDKLVARVQAQLDAFREKRDASR